MSKRTRKTDRRRQEERTFSVRAIRRDPPDVEKLSRAFIGLALARARAEAEAKAALDATVENLNVAPPGGPETEVRDADQ